MGFFDSFKLGVGKFFGSDFGQAVGGIAAGAAGAFLNQGISALGQKLFPTSGSPLGTGGSAPGTISLTPQNVGAILNAPINPGQTLPWLNPGQSLPWLGNTSGSPQASIFAPRPPPAFNVPFTAGGTIGSANPATTPHGSFTPFPGPGGFQVAGFPTTRNVGFTPALFDNFGGLGNVGQLPPGAGQFSQGALPPLPMMGTPMFRATMAGATAQFFRAQNPATGQDTWFRPAGRPLLWSGDLTACKRVNKVARRAARKR